MESIFPAIVSNERNNCFQTSSPEEEVCKIDLSIDSMVKRYDS